MPSQRHIGEFDELDGEGGIPEKKITRVKTENNIYYKGEKNY